MRGELSAPLALGDVTERQPVAEALDADRDQADAHPRVEPLVQQPELGRAARQLKETERGAEGGEAAVGHDRAGSGAVIAWFTGYIDCSHRHGLSLNMLAAVGILIIFAITVLVSVFVLGYIDSRDRNGLPWEIRRVADDILVIGAIMVFLSLFLFRW
jgi:hypothetical protein